MKTHYLLFALLCVLSGCLNLHHGQARKSALIIQNFRFASLGIFNEELVKRNYSITAFDAEHEGAKLAHIDPLAYDLVVVLGGLMSANDTEKYPYLKDEMRILKIRDENQKPSIGICLGAQLMARSLGASVYKGPQGREFGIKQLLFSDYGKKTPFTLLSDYPVMEAHNDTFDLPPQAVLLASSLQYKNQAFIHNKSLALQFHPEVDAKTVQVWMDIFQRNDDIEMKNNFKYLDNKLRPKILQFWRSWLDVLGA